MKLAILLPNFQAGGAERVNLDLAFEIKRQGHAVEFVLQEAVGENLDEACRAFTVHDMSAKRVRNLPIPLARFLRKNRPDALLVSMWPLTVVAPLARALSGHYCKLVVWEHNTLSVQYRSWGRFHRIGLRVSLAIGHRFVDARVGVSKGVAEDIARLALIQGSRYHVIWNPVPLRSDPTEQSLAEAESLWSSPVGGRILTVGRFKEQKNHPLLLRSFSLLARNRDLKLMFLGEGHGESSLRKLAEELGISAQVIFAGFRLDPTPFYRTADLFVLSSDHEGLPTVLIEALANGLPIVSTDCPSGPAEILENGRWGVLVPRGDVYALKGAIEDALSTEHNQGSLKQRALDFSPTKAANEYLRLLQR